MSRFFCVTVTVVCSLFTVFSVAQTQAASTEPADRTCDSADLPNSVSGEQLDAVRNELVRLKIKDVRLRARKRVGVADDTVLGMLPPPGSKVCLETPVVLFYVRNGDEDCIDTVVGLKLGEARATLAKRRVEAKAQPLCGAPPDPERSRVISESFGFPLGVPRMCPTPSTRSVALVTEFDAELPRLAKLAPREALERLNLPGGPKWLLCVAGEPGCIAPPEGVTLAHIDRIDRRQCRIDAVFVAAPSSPPPAGSQPEPQDEPSFAVWTIGALALGGVALLGGMSLGRAGFSFRWFARQQAAGTKRGLAGSLSGGGEGLAGPLRLRVRRDVQDTE